MGGYHTKIQGMIFSSMHRKNESSKKKKKFARQTFPELLPGGTFFDSVDGFSVRAKGRKSHRFHVNKASLVEVPKEQLVEDGLTAKAPGQKKECNELIILLRRRSVGASAGGRRRHRGSAGRDALRLTAGRYRWQVERFSEEEAAALQAFLRQGLASCLMAVAHLRTLHCPKVTKGWSSCPDIKNLSDITQPLAGQGEAAPAPTETKTRTRHFIVRRVAEEEIMGKISDEPATAEASAAAAGEPESGEDSASNENEKKLHVHWEDLEH